MKIDIIGRGNVGSHLLMALKDKAETVSVSSRSLENLRSDSDLYIICVSDNAILEVARNLMRRIPAQAVVAHTSGSTPLAALDLGHPHFGVIYPLQTFSKEVELDYGEIPFFIEASDQSTRQILEETVKLIGAHCNDLDSDRRRDLHLASVIACNFANHLWALADVYLKERGLAFSHLVPLLKETIRKAGITNPMDAQTGPACRHDTGTIEAHVERLRDSKELSEIYRLMSESIMNHHPIEK